ncbi:MAG: ABC-type transport auxiliary lipoprotein family protein [Microvirga sp.]|nr:ABC-type transport auxiliary lipoprotein family protein [Microvirga sp.]
MIAEKLNSAARPASRRLARLATAGLLGLALAGCASSSALTVFSLSAPENLPSTARALPGLLLVAPPTAIQIFATERIVVREADGSLSYLPDAQWADQLPALLQSRMIASFENSRRIAGVSRPGDRVSPDFQLNTEVRAFEIDAASGSAVVELSVRAVSEANGQIARARVFRGTAPVGALSPGTAVSSLDAALSQVLVEIVAWAGS